VPNIALQRAPLNFQQQWPAGSQQLFDPAVVDERGVYVVGSPDAVAVFQVYSRARAWFTIVAKQKITGYAVSAGALYVQDGPVVSGWDLTYGGCFGGFNIQTKQKWTPPQSAEPLELALAKPPDSLFHVPAASASADAVVYSPPVVRASQMQGEWIGQVFVLGSDGSITSLNDDLTKYATAKFRAPLRPELAMGELPQTSGDTLCRLYYIEASGGIVAINASLSPLAEIQGWATKGTPVPAKVLPLRFVDGLLWGGGILGADFFALTTDATQPPRLTVASPPGAGWRDYDINTDDKLALVSDRTTSRLIGYGAAAKQRDRWQARVSASKGVSRFWPGFGDGDRGPTLALEVDDELKTAGVGFRVALCNPFDALEPSLTPNYPPASTQLDAAILTPGSFTDDLSVVALARSKPIISRHTLYLVVRAAEGGPDKLAVFALASERGTVLERANARLAELRILSRPVRVHVTKQIIVRKIGQEYSEPASDGGNASFQILVSAGEVLNIRTDGKGIFHIDPKYHGMASRILDDIRPWSPGGRVVGLVTPNATLDCLKDTEMYVGVIVYRDKA
jgi:hypothetical protein